MLEKFGIIPVDYTTVVTALGNYKSPKDKLSGLENSGDLIRLKKGLFVVASKIHNQQISKQLIANHLYGPSYVSLESALSFYGLIPERVYSTRSMTLKRGKIFSTPLGDFDYVKTSAAYFKIGVRQEIINDQYAYLIGTPEKSICDMIIATPSLRLQSVKAMQIYLEEDLRMDLSAMATFDIEIIQQCLATGRKKIELTQLCKLLKNECV